MADFEKETTKKMNDTIADVKKKAKDEVHQAEKTAKKKIAEAKGENKLFKKKKRGIRGGLCGRFGRTYGNACRKIRI